MEAEDCNGLIKWPWNVGEGDSKRRTLACIITAMEHPNVITRHVCREILAEKLNALGSTNKPVQ